MPLTLQDLKETHKALSERNWAIFADYNEKKEYPSVTFTTISEGTVTWSPSKVRLFLTLVEDILFIRERYPESTRASHVFSLASLEDLLLVVEHAIQHLEASYKHSLRQEGE